MKERALLLKHIDLFAVAAVLMGYFLLTSAHNAKLPATAVEAARVKLQRKIHPVHVGSKAYRWMRVARSLGGQQV